MTKRIFRSIAAAALAVLAAVLVAVTGVLYTYFSHVQRHQLRLDTVLAA